MVQFGEALQAPNFFRKIVAIILHFLHTPFLHQDLVIPGRIFAIKILEPPTSLLHSILEKKYFIHSNILL